jgi:putative redox protein
MEAKVIWKGKLSFNGSADSGFTVPLDGSKDTGGDDDGFRPMELVAIGLAGCTAMDVISILTKKRQDVTGLEVRVHSEKAETHPHIFTHMTIEYIVSGHAIDPAAVDRSIELSSAKYCPVQAMLNKTVAIDHKVTLLEAA